MHYLAYGSNLHPHRLGQRIPSARLSGTVRLPGYRLLFQKKSRDGSAKCMFEQTGTPGDALFGAVYEIDTDEKPVLDAIEGLGQGYDERQLVVDVGGIGIETFTYAAAATHIAPDLRPYHWYKELVLLGACYHRLPDDYTETIRAVASIADPDSKRAQGKEALLRSIREINRASQGVATC